MAASLADTYRGKPSQHTPQSLSGDFRELYLLTRDEIPSAAVGRASTRPTGRAWTN